MNGRSDCIMPEWSNLGDPRDGNHSPADTGGHQSDRRWRGCRATGERGQRSCSKTRSTPRPRGSTCRWNGAVKTWSGLPTTARNDPQRFDPGISAACYEQIRRTPTTCSPGPDSGLPRRGACGDRRGRQGPLPDTPARRRPKVRNSLIEGDIFGPVKKCGCPPGTRDRSKKPLLYNVPVRGRPSSRT